MSSLLERLRTALAPHYEVERELASGGMGTVFLARDPQLDRPVAIKILRPDLASETASDRFLREARILARLSHRNVVPVHQAGEVDGLSYYVMVILALLLSEDPRKIKAGDRDGDKLDRPQKSTDDACGLSQAINVRWAQNEVESEKLRRLIWGRFPRRQYDGQEEQRHHQVEHSNVQLFPVPTL